MFYIYKFYIYNFDINDFTQLLSGYEPLQVTGIASIISIRKKNIMNTMEKEQLKQYRYERLQKRIRYYKRDLSERLAETRKLFKKRAYAIDIHTHSSYSDGKGTVEENYECAKHAGLDFIFATDHASLGQKRVVRKWFDASWGQEPGSKTHHIGLLGGKRRFKPRCDNIAADYARAKTIAPFVWIPHPVGWYPARWYKDEAINQLWTLGSQFAIEIINGANKPVRAYDEFNAKAVKIWDRLLCDGRKVTALGGSDAHIPDDIGSAWTGIFAKRLSAPSIIKALNRGSCFASEASLLDFSCNGLPMGSTIRQRKGSKIELNFHVVDSAGIASIRIISHGRVIKTIQAKGQAIIIGSLTKKVGAKPAYYRLESTASDDRRAFSTPIYVEPT